MGPSDIKDRTEWGAGPSLLVSRKDSYQPGVL
jgi:hypothetical protein